MLDLSLAASSLLAESYLHNFDSVIFDIWGPLKVRYYGVAYLMGFIVAWALLKWMGRTGRIIIPAHWAMDYITYAVIGVILGGRIGYVLFYDQSLLWPPLDILKVWDGGMSFHGGLIGVILALMVFGHRRGISKKHILDVATFITPPGLFFGRIANFINAELWGKAIPASMRASPPWWSIKYPAEVTDHWVRMQQITDPEALRDLTHRLATDFNLIAPNETALRQLVMDEAARRLQLLEPLRGVVGDSQYFHAQIVEAAHAGDQAVVQTLQPLLTPYYPSQLFQAFAEGLVLWLVLILIWLKPRTMGVVGSWFLICYGILRIVTELFRQPDEGVPPLFGFISRGQQLSGVMALTGLVCLIVFTRTGPRIGGLTHTSPETLALRPKEENPSKISAS